MGGGGGGGGGGVSWVEISIKNKEREKKALSVDPGQSAEIDRNAYSARAPPPLVRCVHLLTFLSGHVALRGRQRNENPRGWTVVILWLQQGQSEETKVVAIETRDVNSTHPFQVSAGCQECWRPRAMHWGRRDSSKRVAIRLIRIVAPRWFTWKAPSRSLSDSRRALVAWAT